MARRPARSIGPRRATLAGLAWALLALLLVIPSALGAGPPFDARPTGNDSHVIDDAEVLPRQAEIALSQGLAALQASTGTDVVVFLQQKPAAQTAEDAAADARALLEEWAVGGTEGDGAVFMVDFDRARTTAIAAIVAGAALASRIDQATLDAIVADSVAPAIAEGRWQSAVTQGVIALSARLSVSEPSATPAPVTTPEPGVTAPPATPRPTVPPGEVPDIGPAPPPGPPWPDPIRGVRVYDHAGLFEEATILVLQEAIARIEDRTGAQIVVYSQVKPESDTFEEAEADAISLMDAWGVGRRGIDDGLVILFDVEADNVCDGQVQLYAGPGYRASYLTNEDRQALFQDQMLPHLRACDFDSAMLAAITAIDANATPERARSLTLARQVDAATGLVLAPLLAIGLLAWAGWSWLRYGKDPEVVDDPSVLMPAPPPGLSPAAAVVVLDGRASRRALTTAMVDLAARGELRFSAPGPGDHGRVSIDVLVADDEDPRVLRNRRVPVGAAEQWALERIQGIAGADGHIDAEAMLRFGKHQEGFEDRLEQHVTGQGWFREPPERSTHRWTFRAAAVLVAGAIGAFVGWRLPSNGLLLVGIGLLVAAVGMFILARAMPQRTMQGAMVNAWLAAYRRTLDKTLAQARSMEQVVASQVLPWVETPDQAVVWGIALGLHEEVEDVLARSVEVAQTRAGGGAWFPNWYVAAAAAGGDGPGGGGSGPSGLFSSSALPDFGAMTAALATIGSSPSSSGSGSSGGGFGGGGSGGGGGGAGGGF